MRSPNTTRYNTTFTPETVEAVWRKGQIALGRDPNLWRLDACGAYMARWSHGDTNSEYGWEIDHIRPVAAGGSDDLSNLQPLQWQNNRSKADNYPYWECAVRAA